MGSKKKQVGEKSSDGSGSQSTVGDSSSKTYDKDTEVFISMSQELKSEGNKLFQRGDLEGAVSKYGKAIKLLPRNHIDVSCLRSNLAACYMQLGISEYPRAIRECDLALEVTPKYSKALLKRARCYEALNRLDLAVKDVRTVLKMEPNNTMALEISEKVKNALEKKGLKEDDIAIELPSDHTKLPCVPPEGVKEKKRKKSKKVELVTADNVGIEKPAEEKLEDKKAEDSVEQKKAVKKSKEKLEDCVEQKETVKKSEEKLEDKKAEDSVEQKEAVNKSREKLEEKKAEDNIEKKKAVNKSKKKVAKEKSNEKKADIKEVIEEKFNDGKEDTAKKTVKLVFGEDIRFAELQVNCSLQHLREVISDRFPSLGAVLVKYRDQEGDLVTITSDEELRWAERSAGSESSIRLYIVDADPKQDPLFEKINEKKEQKPVISNELESSCVEKEKEMIRPSCIEDWIIQFAQLFKNHVGIESDRYLDFHELGMKLYSEAMEETVTSEEAQSLFDMAGAKFQEMAALALFNWGNVHMSRARKKVNFTEESSKEHLHEEIKNSYEWVQEEYKRAGEKYEAAIKIKPDFYEGFLALGQRQFEQAKLSWYYAISTIVDLATWPSTEVLQLYNNAEENMEKGMQIWEESEKRCLNEDPKSKDIKFLLQKMGLDCLLQNISSEEIAAQAANLRSQINILWGTMLYERSVMEFKLGLPVWHECLEVAVEKFELAGASPTDIAVMLKNHCSNNTAAEGLGFNIDEIVQAWNEMYEARRWQSRVSSFHLEPLFRRRASKIYHALELA
ncbi:protein PHOX1 [Neltuma alba]|uniref:protein PHOX1 n=1 Tax=Neltuma alba TaxID=207710 RepID=UPI0010A56AC1|nr:protein PHOX1-like [Prosopis alba]XP_028753987.1 protein PHOX1-like [Prosopis alba]XP_028753988.1 protein PHOX1-like [Prosopis alba]XP_028753989.1 protein PHOX1-like [Prosopis alba]